MASTVDSPNLRAMRSASGSLWYSACQHAMQAGLIARMSMWPRLTVCMCVLPVDGVSLHQGVCQTSAKDTIWSQGGHRQLVNAIQGPNVVQLKDSLPQADAI